MLGPAQFSLWSIITLITVFGVLFTIPDGYILLPFIAVWALIIWGIGRVLYAFRHPINRLVTGKAEA